MPPTAAFDPPVVRPGEQSIYRVTFQALEQSIDWPAVLPAPKQLQLQPGARGQMLQLTGPAFVPVTCINTRVRPSAAGKFSIPSFEVQMYGKKLTVPAATLQVQPDAPESNGSPQLLIEAEKTNLFVGQPMTVRIRLPGLPNGAMMGVQQFQIIGRGLLVDQGAIRQSITSAMVGGRPVQFMTYEAIVTPVKGGDLNFFAQGFSQAQNFLAVPNSPGVVMFSPGRPILLESPTVRLVTRELPREGRLAGFTGAVGKIAFTGATLETNVLRVGDTVKLTASFRCDNDVLRLVPPAVPRMRDWQVFAASTNNPMTQPSQFHRVASFAFTLVPLSEAAQATPPIAFSSFDPEKGAYSDLTIPAIPLTVKPGLAAGDIQALVRSDRLVPEAEETPVLSSLAGTQGKAVTRLEPEQQRTSFLAAQIFPLAGFAGLWIWDRRRRYYERNPRELLRVRARRALRRERCALRRAAKQRNAEVFAARAVSAMRVACAPHYPAEPRALVGKEIIEVLSENGHGAHSSEIIRLVFNATDLSQYNASAGEISSLLARQADIEGVIRELEARL